MWLVVEALIVYLIFPETHDRTLEDLSFFLEGEDINERVIRDVDRILDEDEGLREEDRCRDEVRVGPKL